MIPQYPTLCLYVIFMVGDGVLMWLGEMGYLWFGAQQHHSIVNQRKKNEKISHKKVRNPKKTNERGGTEMGAKVQAIVKFWRRQKMRMSSVSIANRPAEAITHTFQYTPLSRETWYTIIPA